MMASHEMSDTYIQDAPPAILETQGSASELAELHHANALEQNHNQEGLVDQNGDMVQDAHHHHYEHDTSQTHEPMDRETDVRFPSRRLSVV